MLAVCAVLAALLFGPPGAIAAIALGWAARRETSARRRRGHALASVGMALGILLTIAWGMVVAVGVVVWQRGGGEFDLYSRAPSGLPSSVLPPLAVPPAPVLPSPDPTGPQAKAPAQGPQQTDVQPGGSVPKSTTTKHHGAITVVDVGVSVSSLSDEFTRQRIAAAESGETVLVMTMREGCDPCRGVENSLLDARMQGALAKVRLVRVDIDVFKEDLDQLKVPRQRFPGFFLLSPDNTPKDGIDGGEWDEDIAVNIAPVLGPFVRGKYTSRRQDWRPLPGSGVAL